MKRTPVGLGDVGVTSDPQERLCVFGLGSCVAVYLFAPGRPESALAHVVLPRSQGTSGTPGRYADTAVPLLVTRLEDIGLRRRELRAAIAGGAGVLGFANDVGQHNVQAVRNALAEFGIPVLQEHTGGSQGRSVEFDPQLQRLEVRNLDAPQASI